MKLLRGLQERTRARCWLRLLKAVKKVNMIVSPFAGVLGDRHRLNEKANPIRLI